MKCHFKMVVQIVQVCFIWLYFDCVCVFFLGGRYKWNKDKHNSKLEQLFDGFIHLQQQSMLEVYLIAPSICSVCDVNEGVSKVLEPLKYLMCEHFSVEFSVRHSFEYHVEITCLSLSLYLHISLSQIFVLFLLLPDSNQNFKSLSSRQSK